jgi:glycine/D-amino acid oxidase-like deaminating enzyme
MSQGAVLLHDDTIAKSQGLDYNRFTDATRVRARAKADCVDLKSGSPFWSVKHGILANYPILKQDLACDVAVIGGGITGALVAHYLCEAGVDVVVVDKRDVGHGSTSATTGLILYEIDTMLVELMDMVGEEHAIRAYRLCVDAVEKLQRLSAEVGAGDFQPKKSVYLASRKRDVAMLRAEHAARRKIGIEVDYLEKSDIEARFSFSRPAALLSHTAGEVDAYELTYRLLEAARERGVRVFDRTTIEAYEHYAHRVELTTDRSCRISAHTVVFATGYETQQYLKHKVVDLMSSYAMASEPLEEFTGWYERSLLWETARPYFYMRTTADGRAIVGGEDEGFKDAFRRDRLIERKTEKLAEQFREMFPAIDMDVAYSWAGTFGQTKDGLPYVGQTREFPGGYFALGYGGNGITFALMAAEIIRDAITGRPNDDAELFRFDR